MPGGQGGRKGDKIGMKKFLSIIIAAAMLLTASTAMAEDDEREYTSEGGYFYTAEAGEMLDTGTRKAIRLYRAPDGIVFSYRLKDDGTVALSARGSKGMKIEFPSTVNGAKVTSVSLNKSMTSLEKIIIPDGVESMYGFGGCEKLKEILIPDTVKHITFSTFQNDKALETIDLPDGLTVIERGLFKDCTALKKIEIPSSVTEIQDNAFSGCSSLEYVDIPPSVEKLGLGAFEECTALKRVEFHEGLLASENARSWIVLSKHLNFRQLL